MREELPETSADRLPVLMRRRGAGGARHAGRHHFAFRPGSSDFRSPSLPISDLLPPPSASLATPVSAAREMARASSPSGAADLGDLATSASGLPSLAACANSFTS